MTLEEQIDFLNKLMEEFESVDRRMKAHGEYDGSYWDTARQLDEVLESLWRLQGLCQ